MRARQDVNRTIETELLEAGTWVGRYILGRVIGRGTTGVVYAARDTELDRAVAIKIVHAAVAMRDPDGRDVRLRQAQSTARLVHRSVVTIHDVGSIGERLFIAMELIDGPTLQRWLQADRPWREVVAVLRDAGEGLAAAHHAGILHLDFKAENVLLAADGRVVVTDFGLALATPVSGGDGGASGDRAGFCRVMLAALWPDDPAADGATKEGVGGQPYRVPTSRRHPPRWLRRVVLGGLGADAPSRYPDMPALLAALDPRRRDRWTLAIGGGVVALGVLFAVHSWRAQPTAATYCDRVGERIDAVWNASVREEINTAFLATGEPAAADAVVLAASSIDGFAKTWLAAQLEVCRAGQDDTMAPQTLDLRVTCLERQLGKATTLLEALRTPDAQTVLRVSSVLGGLGTPGQCVDDERLARRDAARSGIAAEVRGQLDESILRAETLVDTAKYSEAMSVARATLEQARRVGDAWTSAEALLVIAAVQQWLADGAVEQSYHDVLSAALAVQHDRVAAMATLGLIELWEPGTPGGLARVEQWRKHCAALISALGGDTYLEVQLAVATAGFFQKSGHYEEAVAANEAAIAVSDDGRNAVLLASAHANLGGIAAARGRYDEALVRFRRGSEILLRVLGPRHPGVASAIFNVGSALAELGELEAGRNEHVLALAILEENFGPDHPTLAPALRMLAWSGLSRRRPDEALGYAQRALGIARREDERGESTARSLSMLSAIELELAHDAEAFTHAKDALSIALVALGPDHPGLSEFEIGYGLAATRRADFIAARAHFTRAIELRTAAMGDADAEIGRAWSGLAELELAMGDHPAAVAAASRALDIARVTATPRDTTAAEVSFLLARCLVAGGNASARSRARGLARAAMDAFAKAGPGWSVHREPIAAWLAGLPGE